MNRPSRRFALWLIAASLCTIFYIKSRDSRSPVGNTAFSSFSYAGVIVKINGKVPYPGIYRLDPAATVGSVISMTFPYSADITVIGSSPDNLLQRGDTVTVITQSRQHIEITTSRMSVREMILFEIPLQLDSMSIEDWVALPGIGPALAKTIIADRQQNGDFSSIEALQRVHGIGKEKFRLLKQYF